MFSCRAVRCPGKAEISSENIQLMHHCIWGSYLPGFKQTIRCLQIRHYYLNEAVNHGTTILDILSLDEGHVC